MNSEPDWSLWRSFGAVVAAGSLSAAARNLRLSQPTLGRHIENLERALGTTLFERTLSGLKPTAEALRLYEPVQRAAAALAEAALAAAGASGELAGTVRLTASTVTSHYILPPMLRTLRTEFPSIALELVPSDSAENLLLREADIAVRMFRPKQLELISRKLGEIAITACAHQDYLEARGMPREIEELRGHELIGFDRSELMIEGAKALGFPLTRDDFSVRTDNQTMIWQLGTAGIGITFAQAGLVRDTPGMVALLPQLVLPPLQVWLTTHKELFTNGRIRAIYDRLGELLLAYLARPALPP